MEFLDRMLTTSTSLNSRAAIAVPSVCLELQERLVDPVFVECVEEREHPACPDTMENRDCQDPWDRRDRLEPMERMEILDRLETTRRSPLDSRDAEDRQESSELRESQETTARKDQRERLDPRENPVLLDLRERKEPRERKESWEPLETREKMQSIARVRTAMALLQSESTVAVVDIHRQHRVRTVLEDTEMCRERSRAAAVEAGTRMPKCLGEVFATPASPRRVDAKG